MKIKWMAIAISLVFTLTFLAAPSWAGRNDRDGRKKGTHVEKPHKPGHPNRHGDCPICRQPLAKGHSVVSSSHCSMYITRCETV